MFRDAKHEAAVHCVQHRIGIYGVDSSAVEQNVDEVLGLPAILSLTADAETKLFI